jgi:uncharacterized protein involved in outer membrane biogenesis
MKWIKRIAIALGCLLAILVAVPFFIPLDSYIPQIEKAVAAKLQEPVSIKKISLSALPLPHIVVSGITLGKTEDVKVGKVTVTPDLLSLLSSIKVIRSIEIDSLVLTQKGIDRIPAWSKADSTQQPSAIRVESVRLDNALIQLGKATIGPLDARVRLNSKGEPEEASVVSQDGKLKALVTPDKTNYLVDATAKSWKVPFGPAIAFDNLAIKGVATLNDANLNQITAKLYGGTVNGKVVIDWHKGLQVKGNFDIGQVELKQLVPLLSPGINVSGRLNARPVFAAAAANPTQLINGLRLQTPFEVQNGVLHGVDIQKAATDLIRQGSTGGETRFNQLSGHLNLERGAYRFTQLQIASGVLSGDGNVNISPKKELSGRVNAKVGVGLASAGIPLDVSGTVDRPILLPTRAALAGAAAGTLLLPGIGTGLGVRAGQALEGLFGRKQEKKR